VTSATFGGGKPPIQGDGGDAQTAGETAGSPQGVPANDTPSLIQGLAEAGGNGKGERQEERGT
jgi:hypothetical protein